MFDHDYRPGDVISIRFAGVLRHYGVVTQRGTVLSNSRLHGGVTEQSLAAFAAGRAVSRHRSVGSGDDLAVEARARRLTGRSYDLTGANCVHFVRHAHRRKPTPLQVGRALVHAAGDMLKRR